ncbi:hypothetical protein BASA81_007132 [Batrachochytrium salamandrivorans]|nr:hypothetical protein BASA81_007132 [Batrachochytrium salamandrivorans]
MGSLVSSVQDRQARQGGGEEEDVPREIDPSLIRTAFVCQGSCEACLDRKFTCGNAQCSRFLQPLVEVEENITFTCSECQRQRPGVPFACCNGQFATAFANGKLVHNASQLPATVSAVDCGKHLPPLVRGRIVPLAQLPASKVEWQGREISFTNVQLQPQGRPKTDKRYVLVAPKSTVDLSLHYECAWTPKPADYCPGCIVQWYVGIKTRQEDAKVKLDLIRSYYNGKRGKVDQFQFVAPSSPGFYYLQCTITLDYDFLQHVEFGNHPGNSIAVIQVVDFARWNPYNHKLLPIEVQTEINTLAKLALHPRQQCMTLEPAACPCRVLANPDLQSKVFSFLGPYRD